MCIYHLVPELERLAICETFVQCNKKEWTLDTLRSAHTVWLHISREAYQTQRMHTGITLLKFFLYDSIG